MDLPLLLGVDDKGVVVDGVADRAARAWLVGGLVGLPTETVYGLSADAQDPVAVARVYQAKGRPADHPLIVHVQGLQALAGWSAGPNPAAERLVAEFWPGALTVIVARSDRAGDFITGGQDTVALRCPDHPVARACLEALARLSGDPARGVAAPSANRFGRVSPTRALDVLAEVGSALDPQRDLVVDGGVCSIGVESTIVDCTATPPRVLRLGAISQEQVDAVLVRAGLLEAQQSPASGAGGSAGPLEEAQPEVRAPGTLESHYAPRARVVLMPGDSGGLGGAQGPRAAWQVDGGVGLIAPSGVVTPPHWVRLAEPRSAEEYAHTLYSALRQADDLGLTTVVAVPPDLSGGSLAEAVVDRLSRAAHEA